MKDGDRSGDSLPSAGESEPKANGKEVTGSLDDQYELLRSLLVSPEQGMLDEARRRIKVLERKAGPLEAERVAQLLPDAVKLRTETDSELAKALAPTVEKTLKVSVKRDPQPLVDAIFPVIGPAIRKSIAEALSSTLESVNSTMEHSFSLKWRLEAIRTGRPFSEVVLRNTLLYKVEQLFLIDNETGLPVQHVISEDVEAQDGAMVSSMLNVISDFMSDSFGVREPGGLERIEFGDLLIWLEPGPKASLAAVIRGVPSLSLREQLQAIIESFHLRFQDELELFDGDTTPFQAAVPLMEEGLQFEHKAPSQGAATLTKLLMWLAALALLGWLAYSFWQNAKWRTYVAELDAQEGIAITASGKADGRRFVKGLRDPLSANPREIIRASGFNWHDVDHDLESYHTLSPGIFVRRAAQILQPPPTVTLSARDGILFATGAASREWLTFARDQWRFVSGISGFDDAAVQDMDVVQLMREAADIESIQLQFATGSFVPTDPAMLTDVASRFVALAEKAGDLGMVAELVVSGYASVDGGEELNRVLSQRRANRVRVQIVQSGAPAESVTAVGRGVQDPIDDVTVEESEAFRRVAFDVAIR